MGNSPQNYIKLPDGSLEIDSSMQWVFHCVYPGPTLCWWHWGHGAKRFLLFLQRAQTRGRHRLGYLLIPAPTGLLEGPSQGAQASHAFPSIKGWVGACNAKTGSSREHRVRARGLCSSSPSARKALHLPSNHPILQVPSTKTTQVGHPLFSVSHTGVVEYVRHVSPGHGLVLGMQ